MANREDHRVCGLKLRPLCAWQVVALEIAESPLLGLLRGGGEGRRQSVTLGDLRLAAIICSMNFRDISFGPLTRRLMRERRGWRKWRWKLQAMFYTPAKEGKKFAEYVADYFAAFDPWQHAEGAPVGAPWTLARVMSYARSSGNGSREAWLMPLGRLLCESQALAELEGHISIPTEAEEEGIEFLRARAAEEVSRDARDGRNGTQDQKTESRN
jgi:hypothetical protein